MFRKGVGELMDSSPEFSQRREKTGEEFAPDPPRGGHHETSRSSRAEALLHRRDARDARRRHRPAGRRKHEAVEEKEPGQDAPCRGRALDDPGGTGALGVRQEAQRISLRGVGRVIAASPPPGGKPGARPPLWGDLSPGPYAVGYRVIRAFDRTRTWRVTRPDVGSFSPDLDGRPIRLSVWYPADPEGSTAPMRFGDYFPARGPAAFEELDAALDRRDRALAASSVPQGQLEELLATFVPSREEAQPAAGSFPLVLCCGGMNDGTTSNAVLAEFLASHGYAVASVPLLGPTNEQSSQVRHPADLERTVRDLEFGWSLVRGGSGIDDSRLAAAGLSLGGSAAVSP